MIRRTQATGIALSLLLHLTGGWVVASEKGALEEWRESVVLVRRLAENDIPLAHAEAKRLQLELPSNATGADRASLYNLIARIALHAGRTGDAAENIRMAREAATQAGDKVGQIEADLNGVLIAVNRGDMQALRAAVNSSLELLDGVDNPLLITEALLRASMAANRFGQLDDSIITIMRSLEVAKLSGDPMAMTYAEHGMAITLNLNGKPLKALEHYKLMRDHARAAGSRLYEAQAQKSIGSIIFSLGDRAEGERMMQEAIETFRRVGGPFFLAHANYSLAAELVKVGRLEQALSLYNEALQIHESGNSLIGQWWALIARSELQLKLGSMEQAHEDAQRASHLADNLELQIYRSMSAEHLASIAAARGELAKAYELLRSALDLKQQAQLDQSGKRIIELAQRFQSEAKQREIDKLTLHTERQEQIQGWLWTTITGTALVILIALAFLLHLRRSRQMIQALNLGLEEQVQARTAELRNQTSYLRTVIDTLPAAVWLKDTEGRYLTVNAAFKQLTGHQDIEVIGQTDDVLWQSAIGERLRKADLEVMATRHRFGTEIIIPDRCGVPRWQEIDKAPVVDDNGILLGTVGVGRDISERKEAEERLKQLLEFSEGIINAIPDLLFELDINGRYLNVWTHTPELLAQQKEMLLGNNVNDVLSKEGAETVMEALSEADREWLSFGKVFSIDLPQGEAWFELSVSKKKSSTSTKPTFLVLSRDITERIRLETELMDSRNFLDSLVNAVPDPIFVKDREHRWILLNDAYCSLTGWAQETLLGKSEYDIFSSKAVDQAWEKDEQVFESGEVSLNEEHFTSADGKQHFIQTKKTPFIDSGGNKMLVGVIRDLTQRKSYEEARELALKEARRLARSRSEFLANMSHELRSPLNSILGFAQILGRDQSLAEEHRNKISIIQESGEHLLMMINDILDFAKSDADRIELYKSDVPTRYFLKSIADAMREKAEPKGITLVTDFAANLPEYIYVDERRLQQVIFNLLSNAVKFTEQGEVGLQINFTAPQTLRICVSDSGIGIDADRLESIFQPFEQGAEKRYHYAGTGLGLAICRELVRLMGGEIEVQSTLGKGSLFYFEIEVGVGLPGDKVSHKYDEISGYFGDSKSLLVVDDFAQNREVIRDMLTPFGFHILEAANSEDGLAKTRDKRPDLILMDINMSDSAGLEVIRRLRKMPGVGRMPIIAISASVSNDDQAACIRAGADAFLAYPLNLQRTLLQIGALLRLEWRYQDTKQASFEEKPGQMPDEQELKTFLWLAEIGDMRGIVKRADELLKVEPGYKGFCHRLRTLAQSYQTKAVLMFVKQYLEGEH